MANNEEFFCNHCKRETIFYLESDMLWYCDECGNALGSQEINEYDVDDEYILNEQDNHFRCPTCNNLLAVDELIDEYLCPVCFEDVSHCLEKMGYEYDEYLDSYIKRR